MQINRQAESFLEKRRALLKAWRYVGPLLLLKAWRYVGPLLLLGIGGFAVFLWLNTPLLINPYAMMSGIESGSVEQSTLQMMAAFVPVLFIALCFLLVVFILLMYAAFSNEKKFLAILDELQGGRD